MATIKVVLRKRTNKEGKQPLCIQIIINRKSSIIHLGQYINETDWDESKQKVKKTNPNSSELNKFILKRLTEANSKLLELETKSENTSSKNITNNIKSKTRNTFLKQAQIYLDDLKKSGKYNRYSADKPRVNRFKEFLEGDINFEEINVSLLNRFKAYLKGTRRITERTIVNHLVVIRSVFSQAIQAGIVDQKYYPFGKGKIQIKFPDSQKIGLTIEEVRILEELDLKSLEFLDHARNLWLLSFYFAGIRVSDLLRLKWADIKDSRLFYTMGKNAKAGSIKISDKAEKILKRYRDKQNNKQNLIFHHLSEVRSLENLFEVQKRISYAVKTIDEALLKVANMAGIEKKLTMHIARHTFGNISGDKIPIQMLQKLYRHTSITTTIGYQSNFMNMETDEALSSVLSY
ncbi:MAG: site-specific integrase [Saprospiraceae bacterium]|nr:site-specific integrase [Saprospiraceae bacterium]